MRLLIHSPPAFPFLFNLHHRRPISPATTLLTPHRRRSSLSMDTTTPPPDEIAHDYSPFLRIYKTGRVERLLGTDVVPASLDPDTNVRCKDVVFSSDHNLTSRIYIPGDLDANQKLPLIVYFHGGGFCVETPFNHKYHRCVNLLASQAKAIAVSVDYRLAPENPLPVGYDDSWSCLEWIAAHLNGAGPEPWLNSHVDFSRVFLAGDSAGGNIAHQMAIRNIAGKVFDEMSLGIVLIHPYFWGKDPIGAEPGEAEKRRMVEGIWYFACPTTSGCDDPFINPVLDPNLEKLGCRKVLVIVAERDVLKERGRSYYETLEKKSGWGGQIEYFEVKEEDHVFHLQKSECENAALMNRKIVQFINAGK
ncbi:Probable carboxylesterase 13 [Linum grandiflorum]